MTARHVYALIIDSPDSVDEIANIVGKAAADIFALPQAQKRTMTLQTVVPSNGGQGHRPVLRMVEEHAGASQHA